MSVSAVLKRYVAEAEERPGAAWLSRFHAGREEAERWYRGERPAAMGEPQGGDRSQAVGALGFSPQSDAPSCSDCGAIMVRNGSCYKCLNCGATSGCS